MLDPGVEEQEAPSTLGLKVEGGLAGQQDGESHSQEPRAVVRGCSQSEVVARLRVEGGGMNRHPEVAGTPCGCTPTWLCGCTRQAGQWCCRQGDSGGASWATDLKHRKWEVSEFL